MDSSSKDNRKFVNYFYSLEDFEKIKAVAKLLGLSVTSFIRSASVSRANQILEVSE